jgi:hypothetical protein
MHKPDVSELWIQSLRRGNKSTTQSWACIHCSDHQIFQSKDALWEHAKIEHTDKFPALDNGGAPLEEARKEFELKCEAKR